MGIWTAKARSGDRPGWQGLCSIVKEKDLSESPLENIWAQQMTWNATRQRGAPLLPGPGNAGSRRARLEPAVSSNPISLAFHGGLREKVPFPPLGHWD